MAASLDEAQTMKDDWQRAQTGGEYATPHTFNILALQKIGQLTDSPFSDELLWGRSLQWWAFLLLFIGFAIKVPSVPLKLRSP